MLLFKDTLKGLLVSIACLIISLGIVNLLSTNNNIIDNDTKVHMGYQYDPNTDLCFATKESDFFEKYNYRIITNVPCTKKVMLEIGKR